MINTSWTLHKSKILLHQLVGEANGVWTNDASRDHVLKPILRSERVKMANVHLQLLHEELSKLSLSEEKKQKEAEMESAMTELKKAQDALQKSLERNSERLSNSPNHTLTNPSVYLCYNTFTN